MGEDMSFINSYFSASDMQARSADGETMLPIPADATVAMAYVPFQFMDEIYDDEKALQVGTLFPELNKPFYGKCVL